MANDVRREEARQTHTGDPQHFLGRQAIELKGPRAQKINTQIVPDGGGHPDQVGNPVLSGQVGSPISSILVANFQGL